MGIFWAVYVDPAVCEALLNIHINLLTGRFREFTSYKHTDKLHATLEKRILYKQYERTSHQNITTGRINIYIFVFYVKTIVS